MTLHATSAFTITGWEPTPIDDRDGVSLTRTQVTKTFTGDLEGTSVAELLMAGAPHESAAYVGFEGIEGQLSGRAGSFILHHNASSARRAIGDLDDHGGFRDRGTTGHLRRGSDRHRARWRPHFPSRLRHKRSGSGFQRGVG